MINSTSKELLEVFKGANLLKDECIRESGLYLLFDSLDLLNRGDFVMKFKLYVAFNSVDVRDTLRQIDSILRMASSNRILTNGHLKLDRVYFKSLCGSLMIYTTCISAHLRSYCLYE